MISIVDYGLGNILAFTNIYKRLNIPVRVVSSSAELETAERIILPGVGSFDSGIKKLNESGLKEAILRHAVQDKKPLLGICLGMQMLGRSSDEGKEIGLSLIPFDNRKFRFSKNINKKIPHMGWNYVTRKLNDDPLVMRLEGEQRFYFVHSYHAVCDNEENILLMSEYGYPFVAGVKYKNIYGLQFHPEKSHKFGMAILSNFVRDV